MTFSSPFLSVKRVYELLVGKGKQRGLIHNHLLLHTLFIHPPMELPQSIRCGPCSFYHRSQLCPGDVGINGQQACEGGKAAVGSGDDMFAPNDGSIAFQALSDQFRVLDKIGGGIEYAWNDNLIFRQPDLLKYLPLMLMVRIGPFKGDGNGTRLQHLTDDLLEWHIAVMRTFVVPPTEMEPQMIRRDISDRMVQGLQVQAEQGHICFVSA